MMQQSQKHPFLQHEQHLALQQLQQQQYAPQKVVIILLITLQNNRCFLEWSQ